MKRFLPVVSVFLLLAVAAGASVPSRSYTIKPGDSLSVIAKQALLKHFGMAPRTDIDRYTRMIQRRNDVDPRSIYPGQTITLPAYDTLQSDQATSRTTTPDTKPKDQPDPSKAAERTNADDTSADDTSISDNSANETDTATGERSITPTSSTSRVSKPEDKTTDNSSSEEGGGTWGSVNFGGIMGLSDEGGSDEQAGQSSEDGERAGAKKRAERTPIPSPEDGSSFTVEPHTFESPPLTVRKLARTVLSDYTETVRVEDVFRLRALIIEKNNLDSIDYSTNSYILSGQAIDVPAYEPVSQSGVDWARIPEQVFEAQQSLLRKKDKRMLNADLRVSRVAGRILREHNITSERARRQYADFLTFIAYDSVSAGETVRVPSFHVQP